MGPATQFDVEAAIATWRRFLASARGLSGDDLDELETHLRDEIDALMHEGRSIESAYREARRRVGDYATVEAAYKQVYWRKVRNEHRLKHELILRATMLKNYYKIAVRNFRRQAGYSFINVFGLALGMAGCLLILLYVQYERSYDRFHEKADRIVRLVDNVRGEGFDRDFAAVPAPVGPALVDEYPDVEAAVRIFTWDEPWVRYADRRFKEQQALLIDAAVFDVFTFPLVAGDRETALEQPYTIVISETMAEKYFGEEPALGKVLSLDGDDFTVTGVMRDMPGNAHFRADFLASFTTLGTGFGTQSWQRHDFYTYLLLSDASAVPALVSQLPDFVDRHMGERLAAEGYSLTFSLQPLTDIYLHSNRFEELAPTGNAMTLNILGLVGFFILFIACVNFINLTTGRSSQRAQEVGMRKVLGAARRQLAFQFLGESVLSSVLALALALVFVLIFLPTFNGLTGHAIRLEAFSLSTLVLGLAGFALGVGLLAGFYPALLLSSFKPLTVLQGASRTGRSGGGWLRRSLVVVQFVASIGLLIGTGIVVSQLDYLAEKNLGFDREQVMVVRMYEEQRSDFEALKQDVLQHPNVLALSRTSGVPGLDAGIGGASVVPEGATSDRQVRMMWVDFDFPEAFGIDMVAGRSFSEAFARDSSDAFLINETAVRELGWNTPEEAVGQRMRWQDQKEGTVIGVMRDFHVVSLHERINPMVVHVWPQWTNFAAVRIAPGRLSETLDFIESQWQQRNPDAPFDAFFADQAFDQMYRAEQRFGRLFGYFAALAMLIACLGLFGLAAFTAEQRTKEIGIRKVLGASVSGLVFLLTKDVVKLVVIAFVLAAPAAYVLMQRWLEAFAYRIEISWRLFLLVGLAALGVALLTVSYQAVKAAFIDPVKSLRYE